MLPKISDTLKNVLTSRKAFVSMLYHGAMNINLALLKGGEIWIISASCNKTFLLD